MLTGRKCLKGSGTSVDEKHFWTALEFRICGEFAGLPERHRRYWWCDGFSPQQYVLNGPTPCIHGKAWICNGQLQAVWDFTLFLNRPYASRSEIGWASLLPPSGVTCWVAIDEPGKRIQIEPFAAVPDLL
jgi:hypothetical protein